jgi:hypothetical protein
MRTPCFVAVTALLSLLGVVSTGLVGCGGSNAPAATVSGATPAKNLFEYDQSTNVVNEYSLSSSGTPTPSATMTLPSNFIFVNMTQDAAGKIYLLGVIGRTSQVQVFAAGATSFTTPIATIFTASFPAYITVDSTGNIYVNDATNTYWEYSPTGSLLRTLTEPAGTGGNSIAVDTADNLYILDYNQTTNIYEIDVVPASTPTGSITPSRTLLIPQVFGGSGIPASLTVDNTGNLYVSMQGYPLTNVSAIEVFNATATVTNPTRTVTLPAQTAGTSQQVYAVAVDKAGYVYIQAVNATTNPFYGFAPGATTPSINFSTGGASYSSFFLQ